MTGLKVGIGQVEYRPKLALPIMGHIRDDYASRGFHDPLYSKAIVFQDSSDNRFVMLSLDICMLNAEQVALLRQFIEDDTGIPTANILVAATHTHGGPSTMSHYTSPKANDTDIADFLKNASKAAAAALENMSEAKIRVGHNREERLSFNRRLKCKDGKTHMNWEDLSLDFVCEVLGPIDPDLAVVAIDLHAKGSAAIVNFALHPAIIDFVNFDYTADFPGYLSQAMKKLHGKDYMTVFLNGCCGNINHINYADKSSPRRGFDMAQRCGYILAVDATEAIKDARQISTEMIMVSSEQLELQRFKVSDQMYRQAKEFLAHGQAQTRDNDGLPMQYAAPVWVRMYEEQSEPALTEVMVVRIGDLAIVALPGEIFCEIGLEIKHKSPAKHTLIVELANDAIGYVPTEEAFGQGGYEPTPGAAAYDQTTAQKLLDSALAQLNKLFND